VRGNIRKQIIALDNPQFVFAGYIITHQIDLNFNNNKEIGDLTEQT
jgi:hypothetical protein